MVELHHLDQNGDCFRYEVSVVSLAVTRVRQNLGAERITVYRPRCTYIIKDVDPLATTVYI